MSVAGEGDASSNEDAGASGIDGGGDANADELEDADGRDGVSVPVSRVVTDGGDASVDEDIDAVDGVGSQPCVMSLGFTARTPLPLPRTPLETGQSSRQC
jgi:hypothetical protein